MTIDEVKHIIAREDPRDWETTQNGGLMYKKDLLLRIDKIEASNDEVPLEFLEGGFLKTYLAKDSFHSKDIYKTFYDIFYSQTYIQRLEMFWFDDRRRLVPCPEFSDENGLKVSRFQYSLAKIIYVKAFEKIDEIGVDSEKYFRGHFLSSGLSIPPREM